MQEEQLYEQGSQADKARSNIFSMPPCCGSGCAVCVLDYWTEDELEPVTAGTTEQGLSFNQQAGSAADSLSEAKMLEMLEAIEEAQWLAQQIIDQVDGETS